MFNKFYRFYRVKDTTILWDYNCRNIPIVKILRNYMFTTFANSEA